MWYVLWYTVHSIVYTYDLILAHIWLIGLCPFINRVSFNQSLSIEVRQVNFAYEIVWCFFIPSSSWLKTIRTKLLRIIIDSNKSILMFVTTIWLLLSSSWWRRLGSSAGVGCLLSSEDVRICACLRSFCLHRPSCFGCRLADALPPSSALADALPPSSLWYRAGALPLW